MQETNASEDADAGPPASPASPAPVVERSTPLVVSNAILSEAVMSALKQLDTKLAFNMLLVNERLMSL